MPELKFVTIYADGACIPNPGPGGWACRLHYAETVKELTGSEERATNYRMEIKAVLEALKCLKESCEVRLVTDSDYILNGISKWLPHWKDRGWRTVADGHKLGNPVKNVDLWLEVDELLQKHKLNMSQPQTPRDLAENAKVDSLADKAARDRSNAALPKPSNFAGT